MRRAPLLVLAAATAVFAAITLTYALSVPLGSSADEMSHLTYARLISDHASLPGAMVPERQQPPLYYLLSAALLRLQAPNLALRFLSIALGLVTIALVARTVWHLAPQRQWLAVGTAAALALLPGFQFVSASVTDDSVATAAGAWLLLVTTRVALAAAPSTRLLLLVGCSAGVALIAKETDYPLIIVLAAVVLWRWRGRLALSHVVTVALPVAAIAGWWYARNLIMFARPLPPLTPLGVAPNRLRTLAQLRVFVTQSLHGLLSPERYQGSPLILPSAGQVLLAVVAAALLAGIAAGAVMAARSWRRWDPSRRTAVGAYALAVAGAAAFSIGNALIVVFQPQGRYLLVAATGPLLALVWGVQRLARNRLQVWVASAAYAAGALSLSIMGLTTAMRMA
jgi:Dolichyl-phosphate-mannose-protein mannosyltransferase